MKHINDLSVRPSVRPVAQHIGQVGLMVVYKGTEILPPDRRADEQADRLKIKSDV